MLFRTGKGIERQADPECGVCPPDCGRDPDINRIYIYRTRMADSLKRIRDMVE